MRKPIMILLTMTTLAACQQPKTVHTEAAPGTFAYDREFIAKHDSSAVILKRGNAQLLISPKYQAKVFTSSAEGDTGRSFGWIHYKAFDGPIDPHMNAYGGENRFWLGPEGGAYSMFFEKGAEQKFENWHTPKAYDSEPWELLTKSDTTVSMRKDMQAQNYAGFSFSIRVDRKINILAANAYELF